MYSYYPVAISDSVELDEKLSANGAIHVGAIRTGTPGDDAGKEYHIWTYSTRFVHAEQMREDLKIIREELQQAYNEIDRLNKMIAKMEQDKSVDSWRSSPDRSGGAFTEDEINNQGNWA
jgi:hypothetical protein